MQSMKADARARYRPAKPPEALEPGREWVWDYPRPPRLEPVAQRVRVQFAGLLIADTRRAWRVLETSHPPVYYLPPGDVRMQYLRPEPGSSLCEWKGRAAYYSLVAGDQAVRRAAWSYPEPSRPFAAIRGHLAFYAGPLVACFLEEEKVRPQPGSFYGGWITDHLVGPFKGKPGSEGW
jgi:uncharacterized protein (DUF427 family)